MLLELMRPIALVMSMLSLGTVFNAAFLHPASGLEDQLWDCLLLLGLAAGVCFSSAMIFRESGADGIEPVLRTLPMQMFFWAVGTMVLLFLAAWYLQTHCIFYRDLRRL